MDILNPSGTENIIEIARKLGDLGSKLPAEDPRAGTLNTFTKNVLFTAIFMNKQPTGNEMFQTSYHSLLETADQMMALLSQQFKDLPLSKIQPLATTTFPAESVQSGLTTASATTASSSSSSSEEEEEETESKASMNIEKTVDDLFNSAVASVPAPEAKKNDENKEEEESSSDSFSTSSESEEA